MTGIFFVHNSTDELAMVFGLGQYPNLGTQDAFAALRLGDKQHVLRSSRELGDRLDALAGPCVWRF